MMDFEPITLATARRLLNFEGRVTKSVADQQLEGAVALHNLLASGSPVAYLADEVGMGKTLVVLGTIAILRHYHPQLRVLYIVPKANLQEKWLKEIRNFTANNWQVEDHRVKSFQGTPVSEPILCENLLDLVREAALDANRDFILRLSSFSLPLSSDAGAEEWTKRRKQMRQAFPGLAEAALEIDGRGDDAREERKDAFACAVNRVLPHFDVLVFDEGHNLKHGFKERHGAARNRLLAYVLGRRNGPSGRRLERRIDRAIILSATPVDESFRDLWNQLDVLLDLGDDEKLAESYAALRADEGKDEVHAQDQAKRTADQFLIRRLTRITVAGTPHTRNMYRREWRGGGVSKHDDPLKAPDDLQRLVVALMQKKVADILDDQAYERLETSDDNREPSGGRDAARKPDRRLLKSRRFQIGMLASFESFEQTTASNRPEKARNDDSTFYQTEQSDDQRERHGIDTVAIVGIANRYRNKFRRSLPHPKMNAVVDDLWNSFLHGRKTLVFVRRIQSVPEIVEKLTEKYDDWLSDRIRNELPRGELRRFNDKFEEYRRRRNRFYAQRAANAFAGGPESADDARASGSTREEADLGGSESFFSWFFRGKGPAGILSGASFSRNRLEKAKASAQLSTLFDDNWLLWILGYPAEPLAKMASLLEKPVDRLAEELRRRAATIDTVNHPSKKPQKRNVFLAYQQAALEFVAGQNRDPVLAERARVVLDELGWATPLRDVPDGPSFPDPQRYLGLKTFFTELAREETLRAALWPDGSTPPSGDPDAQYGPAFVEREQRRLLLDSAIRLGHPMVDLWLLYAKLTNSLAPGRPAEAESRDDEPGKVNVPLDELLAQEFVKLLHRQRQSTDEGGGPTSFAELHRIATNFSLLVDVNFHDMRGSELEDLPTYFGSKIGQQQPFAGMHGGFSKLTVRQFRMPGYPYVLVTTDVLQEGEDLHTFCDRVVHYGISWTPSAIEQRIGRVDRIGSLVQRRLESPMAERIDPDDYLQVYFPYLNDTYEFIQVKRVFDRLNRFLKMLHELRLPRLDQSSKVDVNRESLQPAGDEFQPYREPLTTGFPISLDLLDREGPAAAVVQPKNERLLRHFEELIEYLQTRFSIERNDANWTGHERRGKVFVHDGRILGPGEDRHRDGVRQQPFCLTLRTTHGGRLLLRCASSLGPPVPRERFHAVLGLQQRMPALKVCADSGNAKDGYRLSIHRDLLFSCETTQSEELEHLVAATLAGADVMERALFEGKDHTEAELTWGSSEDAKHGSD